MVTGRMGGRRRGRPPDAHGPLCASSKEPARWQPWVCRRGFRPTRGRGAELEPGRRASVEGRRGAFAWSGELGSEGAGGTECASVCLSGQGMSGLTLGVEGKGPLLREPPSKFSANAELGAARPHSEGAEERTVCRGLRPRHRVDPWLEGGVHGGREDPVSRERGVGAGSRVHGRSKEKENTLDESGGGEVPGSGARGGDQGGQRVGCYNRSGWTLPAPGGARGVPWSPNRPSHGGVPTVWGTADLPEGQRSQYFFKTSLYPFWLE